MDKNLRTTIQKEKINNPHQHQKDNPMSNTTIHESQYNILVIGKSGVGKSSLLNYFLDADIAQTGVGKPVTQQGFYKYKATIRNLPIAIFDSWGLEAGKYTEWLKLANEELAKHGASASPSEWFHCVFYCITAGGHRVEDADLDIIEKLQRQGFPVSVVLTKIDQTSLEQQQKMEDAIRAKFPHIAILPATGRGVTNRQGPVEPSGRDALIEQAMKDFFLAIALRLPDFIQSEIKKNVEYFNKQIKKEIINELPLFYNHDEVNKKLHQAIQKAEGSIQNSIIQEIKKILAFYKAVANFFIPITIRTTFNSKLTDEINKNENILIKLASTAFTFLKKISFFNINAETMLEKYIQEMEKNLQKWGDEQSLPFKVAVKKSGYAKPQKKSAESFLKTIIPTSKRP